MSPFHTCLSAFGSNDNLMDALLICDNNFGTYPVDTCFTPNLSYNIWLKWKVTYLRYKSNPLSFIPISWTKSMLTQKWCKCILLYLYGIHYNKTVTIVAKELLYFRYFWFKITPGKDIDCASNLRQVLSMLVNVVDTFNNTEYTAKTLIN